MRRREFCKILAKAATAAVTATTIKSEAAQAANAFGFIASGFNKPDESYADFCGIPEFNRVFYAVKGNDIVAEKLNEHTWRPTGWGRPPLLPVPGGSRDGVPNNSPIPNLYGKGPYKPTYDSLLQYECPEWYRDAKFGIWNHWSPQCVPEDGDWYARNMYTQHSAQYNFQCKHYGHPCKFGYKDLCAQWTLLNWQPEELMDLYVAAGAKLFLALANHHDGFDTWHSRHHEWNAFNIGPRRDVIGEWAKAARARSLPFGVTVHQGRNWWWFQTAHGSDKTGLLAGIPYDGHLTKADGRGTWWDGYDPQQLYGAKHPHNALPDFSYVKNFYDRTRDLIDQHNPELLYFDNALLPLGWAGMNLGAYFYNNSLKANGGTMRGVITTGNVPSHLRKAFVYDIESGVTDRILRHPWQSETCIGDWHYQRALYNHPGEYGAYRHPQDIIRWMIDVVSKNGTFILDIPGKPDGTIDSKEKAVLKQLAMWFAINGEAIYATRPWKVFGEGHLKIIKGRDNGYENIKQYDAHDIRFTRNKAGTVVYAIFLGWHPKEFVVESFGLVADTKPGKVLSVELLGSQERLSWRQTAQSLAIATPKHKPGEYAFAFKVSFAS
ncbi:MAG: alpha-L-fucosidase [Phycisphaerales bacterium]|nr:alpha-L-fucosidase [Phycisphaerales bacterium]